MAGQLPAGYSPAQLQQAYALPAAASQGATVAVIDAYDLPTAETDLAAYRSRFGLPACTSASGCFRKVDQRGGTSYPSVDPQHSWGPETAIDIEMVSAACPACRILLVEAEDASATNLGAAANTAVQLGARYVSNSYGILDAGWDFSPYDAYYDHPGVVITAASGDSGYGAQFPASSRFVTAVGGTTLSPAATGRGWTETAWSGSGSGCSSYSVKPTWQTDTGCVGKTVADIAAVADPATGVAGYGPTTSAPYSSAWQVFGGTSVAAPLVAAMYALAGTPAAGTYPAAYPYEHPEALNDVVQGSNGTGCPAAYLCTAAPGYDGPTGLGTPNGVRALGGPAVPAAAPVQNDFNSDSKSDVLARSTSGALFLYRGDGSGGWLSPPSSQVGSGWGTMTVLSPGDFDGDGRNDVFARDASGLLWLYPGDGASGWLPRRQVGSGWGGMRSIVAARDFSGDGAMDVLATDAAGTLWLYPGDGRGGWLARSAIGSGWGGMTAIVGIADFDGDGKPDLLARDGSGRLWLYAHTPSGWKPPAVVGTGWNAITAIVSPGDVDGDGHDDVLGRTSTGALVLYPGNGRSGWGTPRQIGSGWNIMTWIG